MWFLTPFRVFRTSIHQHPEREFILKFSAMEIYNEAVRDLLSSDATPLRLLDDPEVNTVNDSFASWLPGSASTFYSSSSAFAALMLL